ncbi:hypothetical protein C8034_v005237 [Colletotrichum sidae]|uniref:Uncharacterized protein n=1 Tax=Colletotrichum sidae TaxID=1347389 RepID=A0A4R8T6U7_9PEZI|nr:hypothetical protein C8034_v005237 [Colletotrichum sidae]
MSAKVKHHASPSPEPDPTAQLLQETQQASQRRCAIPKDDHHPSRQSRLLRLTRIFDQLKDELVVVQRFVAVREIDMVTAGRSIDPRGDLAALKGVVNRFDELLTLPVEHEPTSNVLG